MNKKPSSKIVKIVTSYISYVNKEYIIKLMKYLVISQYFWRKF